jgi:hypothetical protein
MSDHPPIAQMCEELRRTQRDFLDILGQADARTLHRRAAEGVWTRKFWRTSATQDNFSVGRQQGAWRRRIHASGA